MPWSEHTVRCFRSVPEMRHGCSKRVGLSLLCLGRAVASSIVVSQVLKWLQNKAIEYSFDQEDNTKAREDG